MSNKKNRNKNQKRRVVRRSPLNNHTIGRTPARDWYVSILVAENGEPTDQFMDLFHANEQDNDYWNLSQMVEQADPSYTAARPKREVYLHAGPQIVTIAGEMFMNFVVLADTNCAEELTTLTAAIDGLSMRVLEGNMKVDEELSDGIVYEAGNRIVGAVFR